MDDAGEAGASLDKLSIFELIVFLVLEQLADLEACQLAADVVLHLYQVQELQALGRLLYQDAQLVVIGRVHEKLY